MLRVAGRRTIVCCEVCVSSVNWSFRWTGRRHDIQVDGRVGLEGDEVIGDCSAFAGIEFGVEMSLESHLPLSTTPQYLVC